MAEEPITDGHSESNPAQSPKSEEFWHAGLRFECQGSGKCCTSRGEYGFVYITDVDLTRLASHLDMHRDDVVSEHCQRTGGWLHLRDPQRDCHFLADKRCGIYEGRPRQCRTWPFWRENLVDSRTWNREVLQSCAGAGKGRQHSRREILRIIDEDEES